MKLKNDELKKLKAGASAGWIVTGIIAGIGFIIGILDGYTRPFKCR